MEPTRYYPVVTSQDRELPFYIATIGAHEQGCVHRPHGIEDYQLLYTESGTGSVIIDGKEYTLHPKCVLYLPPFSPHEYRPLSTPWVARWITFNGYAIDNLFKFRAGTFLLPDDFCFTERYDRIYALRYTEDWSRGSSRLLYELLLDCKDCIPVGSVQLHSLRNQLSPVMHYLSTHYTETIELSDLADLIYVTVGHFCRIFHAYTNMRPMEYVTKLRLQRAKTLLLREPERSVSSVGQEVGYRSDSYFIYTFRKSEGTTPAQFRKINLPSVNKETSVPDDECDCF